MSDMTIAFWWTGDRDAVIEFIVGIQQGEFGLAITANDQPDLADVEGFYQQPGGQFWVARDGGVVVGTIAAIVIEANTVVLRKMFVAPSYRGPVGLADELMGVLIGWAKRNGYRTILLGTTDRMTAAHRFYIRHQFGQIDADRLPAEFPRMAVDSLFFRRDLIGVVAIRDYDPAWPETFDRQRDLLLGALDGVDVVVEHTGSTSVPGLPAKPIIDITMTVPDSADETAYVPLLEEVGYSLTIREPDWFEHRVLNRDWPRVNLHVFTVGCEEVARMTGFRDHLRTSASDRELYASVKRQLAERDWENVQDYADAKTEIVADIMTRVEPHTR
jgi:GrpB-like predicted nucleotidyltransferase (UPF0157 family)/N-acetylglutamate synthase-like GNAT family acetyltransferase